MTKDHKRLTKLLESFKKTPSKKNLLILKSNIERHQFIEEKFIFKAFITANEMYDIFKLMDEHKQINEIIEEIDKKIQENHSKEIKEIESIHSGHIKYEEEFLYPKLENLLDNNHKKELLLKIKKNR